MNTENRGKTRFLIWSNLPMSNYITGRVSFASEVCANSQMEGGIMFNIKIVVCNAFSLGMLKFEHCQGKNLYLRKIGREQARCLVDEEIPPEREVVSAVGHKDTAEIFSKELDRNIPWNRINIELTDDVTLLVGQISGGRLPEGTTELPDDRTISWITVSIDNTH